MFVQLDADEYFELLYRQRDYELAIKEAELRIAAVDARRRACLTRLATVHGFDATKVWRFDDQTHTLTLEE